MTSEIDDLNNFKNISSIAHCSLPDQTEKLTGCKKIEISPISNLSNQFSKLKISKDNPMAYPLNSFNNMTLEPTEEQVLNVDNEKNIHSIFNECSYKTENSPYSDEFSDLNETLETISDTNPEVSKKHFDRVKNQKIYAAFNQMRDFEICDDREARLIDNKVKKEESPDPLLYSAPMVKAVSSQELQRLREAIESGDEDFFHFAVWKNVRMLISLGDNPQILKDDFCYNALHIAAISKQPQMCKKILNVIEDETFYYNIFDTAPEEIRPSIMHNVIDSYLNSPDKILGETPLHFASKFGCLESVKILLNHPLCNSSLKNIDGETAEDLICSRVYPPSLELSDSMKKAFCEIYHNPLLVKDDDRRLLEKPCHHIDFQKTEVFLFNDEEKIHIELESKADNTCPSHKEEIQSKKYYGISLPYNKDDVPVVYDNEVDAIKFIKVNPTARFKVFNSVWDAVEFSRRITNSEVEKVKKEKIIEESPDPLSYSAPMVKAVSSQELGGLREAIEAGDDDFFQFAVWRNARMLISYGDNPRILKEGFRYNALHIAARSKQPQMCKEILNVIGDETFYYNIFDTAPEEIRPSIMHNVIDSYLNSPDKRLGETPLHFASKFGCLESVKILLNHPLCNPSLKNIHGETAEDLICSRVYPPSLDLSDSMKKAFFELYYIPLLGEDDELPWIEKPCRHYDFQKDDYSSVFTYKGTHVRAVAGPMTLELALKFFAAWKNPLTVNQKTSYPEIEDYLPIIHSGMERGLERIGLLWSLHFKVGWKEYWEYFLKYLDLSSIEGLILLEKRLNNKAKRGVECFREIRLRRDYENKSIEAPNASEDIFVTPPSSPPDEFYKTPPSSPQPPAQVPEQETFLYATFKKNDVLMLFPILISHHMNLDNFPFIAIWIKSVSSKLQSLKEDSDYRRHNLNIPLSLITFLLQMSEKKYG